MGRAYNGVVIDTANGLVITTNNNLVRTKLNATEGFFPLKNIHQDNGLKSYSMMYPRETLSYTEKSMPKA
ncbi:hypothetical protein FHR92_004117 [Fontibacillus solani]|uniref:Uncharacterized protein n=1 Tax=Fontibacillus solani TaxID=1572857 RepID=A0A7W3XTB7_9BACL|nr:hypothetical protein [Fontibacillus solani]